MMDYMQTLCPYCIHHKLYQSELWQSGDVK